MRKPSWREVEGGLREQRPSSQMRPAGEFWADFNAKAALRTREQPSTDFAHVFRPAWALGAAAALLIALSTVLLRSGDRTADTGVIRSVEVLAPHSGLVIIEGVGRSPTVIRVVDMQLDDEESTRS